MITKEIEKKIRKRNKKNTERKKKNESIFHVMYFRIAYLSGFCFEKERKGLRFIGELETSTLGARCQLSPPSPPYSKYILIRIIIQMKNHNSNKVTAEKN